MNFALLWLEILMVGLIWTAAWGAWIGRVRRRWIRGCFWALVMLLPLAWLGLLVAAAGMMKFGMLQERNWFYYFLSLWAACAVGMGIILILAGRREPGQRPAAATWRRGGLALAWLISVVMAYITLGNMDLAVQARIALLSVKADSLYLATLPAIVSENQNAAPIYQKAMARMRADPPGDILNPPFGEREHFDPKEPATLAYLKRQASTLALLHQAAAKPACRFDWEVADFGMNAPLNLNDLRAAAYLLDLHAREALTRGKPDEAIADTAAIYAMSRQVGHAILVSALVGMGINGLANSALERTLPAVKRPEDLANLHLNQLPSLGRMFQQAMRGEERYGLRIFGDLPMAMRQMEENSPIPLIAANTSAGAAFYRVFFSNVDGYVRLMKRTQTQAVEPYYKVQNHLPTDKDVRKSGLLTALIMPSMSAAMKVLARVEATNRCARVAVAMTRYRLDHGKSPSQLEELIPAYLTILPTDPFDGKPVRLTVKKDQWIIYSVGPDQSDDGGMEYNAKSDRGDVIFTLKVE